MVTSAQSYSATDPCPICGGHEQLERGIGERCHGFRDGSYAFCTREEHAGSLQPRNGLYRHWLGNGTCHCGVTHLSGSPHGSGRGTLEATFYYSDATGRALSRVQRYRDPKGFSQQRPDGSGGWVVGVAGFVPLVPFNLHKLVAAERATPVYVVEGEKCAQALVERGLLATTNPMGAGQWPDHFAPYFKGRHIRVLPDCDDAGQAHAQDVAAKLAGVASSVKIVQLPGLAEHGDVVDWLNQGHTIDELCPLAEQTPLWTPLAAWGDPLPLLPPELPAFPVEVLPEGLRTLVRGVSRAYQVPPDLVALCALSCLSAAVGGKFYVQVRPDWKETVNMWIVCPLSSGARKTPIVQLLLEVIEDWIVERRVEEKPIIKQAEAVLRIKQQQLKAAESEAAKPLDKRKEDDPPQEELERRAKDLATDVENSTVPLPEHLLTNDCTPERLDSLLADQKGRVAIISDEGGPFEMMAGRYDKKPNLDPYLHAYCGKSHYIDRQGRDGKYVPYPCLTLGVSPQPIIVRNLCATPDFFGRGLLARLLYALPRSTVGYRETEPAPLQAGEMAPYRTAMRHLLAWTVPDDQYGRPVPYRLELDEAARAHFKPWYRELETKLRPEGELGQDELWGSKLAGNLMRVAALLHLFRHARPPEQGMVDRIGLESVKAALALDHYFVSHAKAAFAEMGMSKHIERTRAILDWVRQKRLQSFSKREAWQALHGRRTLFERMGDLDEPLEVLSEHDYVRPASGQNQPHPKGGRPPSTRYVVNPQALRADTQDVARYWKDEELGSVDPPARAPQDEEEL